MEAKAVMSLYLKMILHNSMNTNLLTKISDLFGVQVEAHCISLCIPLIHTTFDYYFDYNYVQTMAYTVRL